MTADIVNLNKVRKSKVRDDEKKRATENRAKFGRTKEQRRSDKDDAARQNTLLDGAKRDDDGSGEDKL